MRINKKVYPELESIQRELNVTPFYVSEYFKDECIRNEAKFLDDASTYEGLFFTESFKKIACRPFIYLFSGGGISYGIHGEWVGMADQRGRLFKMVRDGEKWFVRDCLQAGGHKLLVNSEAATHFHKLSRLIGLFKEFAEVQYKTLPPNGKHKEFNCRYKSDFNFPIGLLTENWYTESCQSHPFVVRGHWRWQACGQMMKDRKLIWIDTFMKDGYTKGAYKEQ